MAAKSQKNIVGRNERQYLCGKMHQQEASVQDSYAKPGG